MLFWRQIWRQIWRNIINALLTPDLASDLTSDLASYLTPSRRNCRQIWRHHAETATYGKRRWTLYHAQRCMYAVCSKANGRCMHGELSVHRTQCVGNMMLTTTPTLAQHQIPDVLLIARGSGGPPLPLLYNIDVLVRASVTCRVFAALRRCEYAFNNLRHNITNVLYRSNIT